MKQVKCYYNDDYIVSDNGDIVRVKGHMVSGNPLKQRLRDDGYQDVNLRVNGKSKSMLTHIVVQCSFNNREYDNKTHEIDHIDDDKSNCKLSNLQLLTKVDNMRKAVKVRDSHKNKELPFGIHEQTLRDYEYYNVEVSNKGKRIRKCFNKKHPNALEKALEYLEQAEIELGIRKPN